MNLSCQLHALAALTPGMNLGIYAAVTGDIPRHLIGQRVIKM